MAHPHHAVRQSKVEKSRVGHITRGYASGGAVDAQPMSEKATKKARSDRDAMAVLGKPARERLDRPGRAKGGRVKHGGKTNVNVIVSPNPQGGAPHPGLPPAAMAGGLSPPGAPPPRPPMPPPGGPPGGPPAMAGAPPPGVMPHRNGGRTYAKGGAVKSGPTWDEGLKNGTPVQHGGSNKSDTANIGRGRVVTFRSGGAVKGGRYPIDTGSGGGEARLKKERLAKRSTNGMAP